MTKIIYRCTLLLVLAAIVTANGQKTNEYYIDAGNGVSLFVKEMGSKTRTHLVFLHGGAGDNHLNFLPHLEAMAKRYHLIFYDQTDAGKSKSVNKPAYSIALEVENLEKIRQHLNVEKLNLVGHSWGSILALSYARAYPQHVNKILLTGSIGTNATYYQRFAGNLQKKITPQDVLQWQQLMAGNESPQSIHEKVMLKHYFSDTANIQKMTRTQINFEVNQAMAQSILTQFDVGPYLSTFDFPVLVVQGKQDLLSLSEIKPGFTELPTVSFVEVDNAGHWVFVEQADVFNRLLSKFF